MRFIAATTFIGLVGIGSYAVYLDGTITRTFEGRRWTVPAQVFAQPLELYQGMDLSQEAFLIELDRLGYNQHSTGETPGTYYICLLYTSPSPRDRTRSRMPSSA